MSTLRRIMTAVLGATSALLLVASVESPGQAATNGPPLQVTTVVSGLEHPWDIAFLPNGDMLYTQRDRETMTLRTPGGVETTVMQNLARLWHGGETGLMSVELASDFATTRDFITCHGYKDATTQDVRVVRWHLGTDNTVTWVRNLITGLPSTSGRHGGCSLQKGGGQVLYVGTGDAATGTNAQNLASGGGKVLRVDSRTGAGWNGDGQKNPFLSSKNAMTRRIWSYGHRNVQGLAKRIDTRMWSIEQGSYRDDEVNLLQRGGNAGWNPVRKTPSDPIYNESVPMTDHSLPGAQYDAKWHSGDPTLATSAGTFVNGAQWGAFNGALAVSVLKDQRLVFLRFKADGTYITGSRKDTLVGTYGRIRAAVQGPGGALYITTSNGSNDRILKVTPVAG